MAVAKWIGILGARLIALGCPDVQEAPAARPRLVRGDGLPCPQSLELVDIPDDVNREQGIWQPRVLHCEAKHVAGAAASARQAERPTQSARPEAVLWHPSHEMRIAGTVVFCKICGGYTSKRRSKLLAGECHGPAQVANVPVRRLREGRHPVTNAFLGEVHRM